MPRLLLVVAGRHAEILTISAAGCYDLAFTGAVKRILNEIEYAAKMAASFRDSSKRSHTNLEVADLPIAPRAERSAPYDLP
jgi:hypothetical protein